MRDKLIELIGDAIFEKGVYSSNGNLIEKYPVRAVAVELVQPLANYLLHNGVTVAEDNNVPRKPMTNADRIRAMSDEELGKFLYGLGYDAYEYALNPHHKPVADTESGWINWLKQPAEVKHV